MSYQHHEAMSPAWTKPAWALIIVSAIRPGTGFIIAGSRGVVSDVNDIGDADVEAFGLPPPPDLPAFYLFEGTCHFDGLDGIDYDGAYKLLGWQEAGQIIYKYNTSAGDSESSPI